MDLAGELGEQGFRWIFVVHGHGSPFHNLILDQACDYFRDSYGGRMVHLRGLEPTPEQLSKLKLSPPKPALSELESKENGVLDIHAGFEETKSPDVFAARSRQSDLPNTCAIHREQLN
jgi:creatinine amidohydrolase